MSIAIVHELRKARGTNKKLEVLKKYRDNDQWKLLLKLMYDTGINYHVSAPSENTFLEDSEANYDEMVQALEALSNKTYTGNAARNFAYRCSGQYGELFRLILGGSLKAGVSTTTINKAYPGLIPEYPLMLAKDVPIKVFPIWGSTKFDGVRLIAKNYGHGKASIITRQGKSFDLEELKNEIISLQPGVYDGELVVGDGYQAGRTKITGYVNKVLLGKAKTIPEYTFCIFDYVPLEEWEARECSLTYGMRYHALSIQIPYESLGNIRVVKQELLKSLEEVESMFSDRLQKGFEGIMLRYKDDPYKWKRSDSLIKKKAIKDCRLECFDTTDGTGKYEGMIGALICKGKVSGKFVSVKIGTGLTDTDRHNPPEHYVGSLIDIEYNDLVKPENSDIHSLFLPRFKRVIRK